MSISNDRGEALAKAMSKLVERFEIWDQAQFRRKAKPEFQDFLQAWSEVGSISLDISKET